jgi:tRNA pseudouridine38-40 synthase
VERGYIYLLHGEKDPFLEGKSTRIRGVLDVDAIQKACAFLVQQGDFASFCKAGSDQKTTLCDVREARWEQTGPSQWRFTIVADRFLRNMVRAIVGTLLEVGMGKRAPEDIPQIMAAKDRSAAGKSVAGCGLYLHHVKYSPGVFKPRGPEYL